MLMLTALKAWWARSRWAVWAIIGVLAVVMLAVLKSLLNVKHNPADGHEPLLSPVPKAIQDRVDQAQEDNLRARVEAKVKADDQKKALDDVLKIDDGAERRKRLAEMLAKT